MTKHNYINLWRICIWLRQGIITMEEAVYLFTKRRIRLLSKNY